MKTKLFITAMALMASTIMISAQSTDNTSTKGQCKGNGKGAAFVDADKNGVCDNYENHTAIAKGNGKCDGNGNKNRHGNGNGKGQGKGNGECKGKNFVDADKNGVCDKFEAKEKK